MQKDRQLAYMGVQNISFLSLETGTDGNDVLHPESKVLQQMWIAVLRYELPRESWMKFLEAHKAQGQLAACRRDLQEPAC